MTRSPERLDALDGLRAIAVAAVVLYHYLYFWTPAGRGYPLLAYGDSLAGLPFVSIGYLGVNLFFIISGFVILLTLERTKDLKEFLLRRTVRLWPPLLIFGTATFLIVSLFGPQELRVGWWEYALSLIALPPQHVAMLVGGDWKWLDGAYWSLWVEAKFYIVIGLLFFAFPKRLISAWIAFELLTLAVGLQTYAVGGRLWHMLDGFLFQPYVPYFSFGLAAYSTWMGRGGRDVRLLLALALAHAALVLGMELAQHPQEMAWHSVEIVSAQAAIFSIFYLFAWRRLPLTILSARPLVRVGRASYGIYLLHQNVGVTILSMPLLSAPLPGLIAALSLAAGLSAVAVLVFERVEKPLQAHLKEQLFHEGSREQPDTSNVAQPGSGLIRAGVRCANE